MSWTAVDVEGRKMWESGDGQRVYDPDDIETIELRRCGITQAPNTEDYNPSLFLAGLIVGLFVGLAVGLLV